MHPCTLLLLLPFVYSIPPFSKNPHFLSFSGLPPCLNRLTARHPPTHCVPLRLNIFCGAKLDKLPHTFVFNPRFLRTRGPDGGASTRMFASRQTATPTVTVALLHGASALPQCSDVIRVSQVTYETNRQQARSVSVNQPIITHVL